MATMTPDGTRTVCTFGYYNPDGARAWVLTDGLRQAGFSVTACLSLQPGLFKKLIDLKRQFQASSPDAVIVMFPGQYILPFAWALARLRGIPLILDAFISQYDTLVSDRRLVAKWSPLAGFLWLVDWLSCRLADAILIDTDAHRDYFVSAFGVAPTKILVIPVGARYDIFRPATATRHDHFTVLFQGTFIPLQGIDVILEAAEIIGRQDPDIAFRLIGRGQTRPEMETLAKTLNLRNVTFVDPMPIAPLADEIRRAHVGLGIFGRSAKAARVIPHKAYDILACGQPLVTGRSPTAEAMIGPDGEAALLTPMGDAPALAAAILRLKREPALAARLAANGRRVIETRYQPSQVVAPLAQWLREAVRYTPGA